MKTVYLITTLILWCCIASNCWMIIRNVRMSKMYTTAIADLLKAKKRCDDTAQKLDAVLDALQRDGVTAALAVFEREDAK